MIATEALTLCRYAANIGVVLLNKYLLSYYGFRFPVLLTLLHMVACLLLTAATVAGGFVRVQRLQTQRQFAKVTLLSMAFTVVIVLGNVSLRLIPVSFNQALGACTPLFTAILERVVQNKHESFWTYSALVPVVLGIIMATGFEPSFHLIGFTACMLATALRAFKTVLQVRTGVCDMYCHLKCFYQSPVCLRVLTAYVSMTMVTLQREHCRHYSCCHSHHCGLGDLVKLDMLCRPCYFPSQRRSSIVSMYCCIWLRSPHWHFFLLR